MAEQDPADGAVKPKGKLKLLILPLALFSMGAGGFVTFSQYPIVSRVVSATGGSEHAEEEAAHEEEAEGHEPLAYGFFHQIDGVIVNPAASGGSRYLMLNIGMEAAEEATLEALKGREIVVRDTIIKLLSMRTVEELAAIEVRNVLKDEVRAAVNGVMGQEKIDRIYFTQYVLQ